MNSVKMSCYSLLILAWQGDFSLYGSMTASLYSKYCRKTANMQLFHLILLNPNTIPANMQGFFYNFSSNRAFYKEKACIFAVIFSPPLK